jgi:hypothetical protein
MSNETRMLTVLSAVAMEWTRPVLSRMSVAHRSMPPICRGLRRCQTGPGAAATLEPDDVLLNNASTRYRSDLPTQIIEPPNCNDRSAPRRLRFTEGPPTNDQQL